MTQRSIGRALRGIGVAGALALTVSGCSMPFSSQGVPEVAATVQGMPISSKTVQDLYDKFATSDQGKSDMDPTQQQGLVVSPKQIRQTALTYQIRVTFLEALAKLKGVTAQDTEEQKEIANELASAPSLQQGGYQASDLEIAKRAEVLSKAIAQKLLPDVIVNPAEIQDAYDQRQDLVAASFKSKVDVAFLDDQASADTLISRLNKKDDFFAITKDLGAKALQAQEVDVSPLSPVQKDFIDTVRGLKTGETSKALPYQVDDGSVYIVLHVAKREDLPKLTVAEATPELTKIVQDDKRYAFFQQWFDKQYREADIRVNKYYGKWNKNFLAVT
jgi:hypothetical protein